MKILCFIQYDEKINGVSKEAISLSQEIVNKTGGDLTLLTFNQSAANDLQKLQSNRVLLINESQLNSYNPLY